LALANGISPSSIGTLVHHLWVKPGVLRFLNPLAEANGKLIIQHNSTKLENSHLNQNTYKRATYKPRFTRSQRTKLYIVENQLYLSGH
jgi:hypothetical protein